MKIGLLTLPFNNNYGGLLQAYALQKYLNKQGHDVWIIKRVPNELTLIRKIKNFIKKILFLTPTVIAHNMRIFESQYMLETEIINLPNKYVILEKYDFDAYIVGSDQVWRYAYTKSRYLEYFFDFIKTKEVKRIAFAASFGTNIWEADELKTKEAARLIKNFFAISVREKSGIDLCKKYFKYKNAVHLLDPTLLHSADFYRVLYDGKESVNIGKIGVYLLDKTDIKENIVANFEQITGKDSFIIGRIQKFKKYHYYPKIGQWLKDFDTADYIITDSFHGMIFSIIFRKPFCVIGNISRGLTRFITILEEFGLKDRLINEQEIEIEYQKLLKEIDYYKLDEILNINIKNTDRFLSVLGQ